MDNSPTAVEEYDRAGVANAKALFVESFPDLTPTVAAAAPGRINLIGEHTDYQEGFVFPLALTKNTYIVAAPLPAGPCKIVSRTASSTMPVTDFELNGKKFDDNERKWVNVAIGMCALYKEEGYEVKPFAAACWTNVPLGAGVSSSAAFEVSIGRLLEELNGLKVKGEKRAEIARMCEHKFVGVECGIMDQMISSCGKKGHALFIECSTPVRIEEVPLAADGVKIVVANSMEAHNLAEDNWYGKRVASCEKASKAMGVANLRAATSEMLESVRGSLDDETYVRAKHVISENERTEAAKDAFRKGELATFGRLMNESHASLRDDYKVSSRGLNTLQEIALSDEGVYGARMTGAGFGGCTVTLVRDSAVDRVVRKMREEYPRRMKDVELAQGGVPDVFVTTAGHGARALSELLL